MKEDDDCSGFGVDGRGPEMSHEFETMIVPRLFDWELWYDFMKLFVDIFESVDSL